MSFLPGRSLKNPNRGGKEWIHGKATAFQCRFRDNKDVIPVLGSVFTGGAVRINRGCRKRGTAAPSCGGEGRGGKGKPRGDPGRVFGCRNCEKRAPCQPGGIGKRRLKRPFLRDCSAKTSGQPPRGDPAPASGPACLRCCAILPRKSGRRRCKERVPGPEWPEDPLRVFCLQKCRGGPGFAAASAGQPKKDKEESGPPPWRRGGPSL